MFTKEEANAIEKGEHTEERMDAMERNSLIRTVASILSSVPFSIVFASSLVNIVSSNLCTRKYRSNLGILRTEETKTITAGKYDKTDTTLLVSAFRKISM